MKKQCGNVCEIVSLNWRIIYNFRTSSIEKSPHIANARYQIHHIHVILKDISLFYNYIPKSQFYLNQHLLVFYGSVYTVYKYSKFLSLFHVECNPNRN